MEITHNMLTVIGSKVNEALIMGSPGYWGIFIQVSISEKHLPLRTQRREMRTFKTVDKAIEYLRDQGVKSIRVSIDPQ